VFVRAVHGFGWSGSADAATKDTRRSTIPQPFGRSLWPSSPGVLFAWRVYESYRSRSDETGAFPLAPIRLRPSQNGIRGYEREAKLEENRGGLKSPFEVTH